MKMALDFLKLSEAFVQIFCFTLPTSVTKQPSCTLLEIVETILSMCLTGVQITTNWLPATASGISTKASLHQFWDLHFSAASFLLVQTTILLARFFLREAIATEAPNKPGPRIVIFSNIQPSPKWSSDYIRKKISSTSLFSATIKKGVMVDEHDPSKADDDWGQPPAPETPENSAKAERAQRILLIIGAIGVFLPFLLFLLFHGPSACGISV